MFIYRHSNRLEAVSSRCKFNRMNSLLLCVCALLAFMSVSLATQTPTTLSDILEQAAFQQDTANDPERAISLYRQVIESEKATREMTAQALYNTGLCYAKLKRASEADQAFGAVVSQYRNVDPYYRLANARLNPSFSPTLPRWQDGERLEYEIRGKNADNVQNYFWTTTTKTNWNGRAAWKMLNRSLGNNGLSMIIADEKNLRPLYSRADNPNLGHATATWTENSIAISRADQERPTETHFEGVVYDGEQRVWLLRQFPMSVGTRIKSQMLPTLLTEKSVPLEVEVIGEEQIQVPAGQFNAYKLTDASGITTYWIDKGPERYLLKIASAASSFQLKSISTVTPGTWRKVASSTSGFGISIPDEWFDASRMGDRKYSATRTINGKAESSLITVPREEIYILDDDTKVKVRIYVSDIKPLQDYESFDLSLAGRVADETEQLQRGLKGYAEREGSKVDRVIANLPAVSNVVDYQERGEEWTLYSTYFMR
ncbi:MAG TPA: tetratricopeptide repeat protein, partial [Povalibacter sp.]|nr:tetratricopeptide repeat protein [Povalibacter sp.]